jgi:hypothetical protein
LQGTADTDVPPAVALRLLNHISSPDLRLTLVRDADHRFSTPACLALIVDTVETVLAPGIIWRGRPVPLAGIKYSLMLRGCPIRRIAVQGPL